MIVIRKNGELLFEPKNDPIRDSRKCVANVTDLIVDSINKFKEIEKIHSSDYLRNLFRETSEQYIKIMEKMESLKADLREYDDLLYELEQKIWTYLSSPTRL